MSGAPPRSVGVGVWLVLATAGISGVSTFVNSYAVAGTNSDAFVTVRNLAVVALIAPLALVLARRSRERLGPRDWATLVVVGLVGGSIPFLLFFRGLQLATLAGGATTASFVYRTLFLWAGVLGLVVLGERPSVPAAFAAGLLLLGNVLLLALVRPVWTDGSLYVLAATALWAGEYTLSRRLLRRLGAGTVALGRMGFGAAFLVAFLAGAGELGGLARLGPGQWEWVGISALLLAGFVATWYPGLRRLELGTATAVLLLGYPVTVLLAAALKGTSTPAPVALGGALVAAGVLVALGPERLRDAVARIRRPSVAPSADGG